MVITDLVPIPGPSGVREPEGNPFLYLFAKVHADHVKTSSVDKVYVDTFEV